MGAGLVDDQCGGIFYQLWRHIAVVIMGDKEREIGADDLTHAANRLTIGMGESFGDHCTVQCQQQPINGGQCGFQRVEQFAQNCLVGLCGHRAGGRGIGPDQWVQFKVILIRAFDKAGNLMKGRTIVIDHGIAAMDVKAVERSGKDGKGV